MSEVNKRERERDRRISEYILHNNLRNDKSYTEDGGKRERHWLMDEYILHFNLNKY